MFYIITLHNLSKLSLNSICNQAQTQPEAIDRYLSLQLLEYRSRSMLLAILWCCLPLPGKFVREYINLQPEVKQRLQSQAWIKKSELQPDVCFNAVFKILIGLVIIVFSLIENRLQGLVLFSLWAVEVYEFFQEQVMKPKRSRSDPRQNIYCCPHE